MERTPAVLIRRVFVLIWDRASKEHNEQGITFLQSKISAGMQQGHQEKIC